ncbi:curli-like amyloid fiber formation chaperone CsgH [Novosphingobium sp. PS1R-30]|uniref:Curli-like amyloid fiber formation chaperone CsgH n=1 Tax=Novosphingobium anseongense TaxID=3133436 RepID=A0ABU8S2G8_9SPHN
MTECWIAAEGQLFVGHVKSPASFVARYELIGEKRGPSGNSVVRQGGQVTIEANRPAHLSQVSFGALGASDHYSVHLRVFDGEQLVGETVIQN